MTETRKPLYRDGPHCECGGSLLATPSGWVCEYGCGKIRTDVTSAPDYQPMRRRERRRGRMIEAPRNQLDDFASALRAMG